MKKITSLGFLIILLHVKSFGWITPTLSSPSNTALVWTGITLDWTAVSGSEQYQLQADTSANFNSTVLVNVANNYINSNSSNSDTEYYLENLYFGKTYYWRVRAYITGDTSLWTGVRTFNTVDYVTLSTPATGTNTWTGLTLDWAAHPGVDFYDLEVDSSASFNSPVFTAVTNTYINSNSSNADTEHYLENLYFGKTYYWRVRSRNTVDTSGWSAVRTFNTIDYVTLSTPATGTNTWTGLTLDWAAHPGVDFYDLEVDSSASFNSPVFTAVTKTYINSNGSNADTEHYLENLYFGKTYYWRVRSRNTVDTSAWSTLRTFNTLDYVTLISPANQQINVNVAGITIDWSAHSGISTYQLQIDTIPLFNSAFLIEVDNNYINSGSSNSDTQYGTGALLSNKLYYWRVRAINTVDTCAWTTRVFSTGSCSPTVQPGSISGSTSTCSGTSGTYSIATVSGATSYSWILPSGWVGFSFTNSISITAGSTSGTITVIANNACGPSPAQTLTISISGAVPATPGIINGNSTVCSGSANTYDVAPVAGATSYIWTLPSGWLGSSTVDSIAAIAGTTSGSITVKASNSCGTSSAQTIIAIISGSVPATPATISGITLICSGSSNTYNAASVSGATNYIWTLPGGWSGSSTTNSIATTASATSGTISVIANNTCGSSAAKTLTISVDASAPVITDTISGVDTVCSGSSNTYGIIAVSGATGYTWTLPNGWTGTSTSNSITTTANSTSGTVSVTANNSCGSSLAQTLNVIIGGSIPATPGTISGTSVICAGISNTYSIATVNGATGYIWTLPIDWTGSSTANYITTTVGAASGAVSVKATNSCGTSAAQTLITSVSVSVPGTPGIISGMEAVCAGTANTYSIATVSGATSYTWTLPSGWSGASSTNSIITTAGSTGGTISIMANNACGSSPAKTLTIAVSVAIPAAPGIISGNDTVCQGSSNTYSISAVPEATTYTWSLPIGWTGSSTTTSVTTTTNSSGGTISIQAGNVCGTSSSQIISIIVNQVNTAVTQVGTVLTAAASDLEYQWVDCNGYALISGQNNQSFSPPANGNYAVIVTQNGCSDTSTCYIISTTGIGIIDPASAIIVYPNPSNGKFSISSNNISSNGFVDIEIYNVLGEKTYSAAAKSLSNLIGAGMEVNLSDSPKGIYLVKVFQNILNGSRAEIYTDKIVVQ